MWNLKFDSYQDVKNVLHKYAYIMSIILSLLAYFLVLPENHRIILNTIYGNITELIPVGMLISIVFGFIISFLFVHMLEFYDKVYDRFVKKWRYRYARDFILPELFRPFEEKLDGKFLVTASSNIREFMIIFYYFVGDRDMKIRKNAIVRFYEAVWKYWATQINEVFFILFAVMLIGYLAYFAINNMQIVSLTIPAVVIVILGVINWVISIYFKRDVRLKTREEIDEIHVNFHDELEEKIMEISEKFALSYGND